MRMQVRCDRGSQSNMIPHLADIEGSVIRRCGVGNPGSVLARRREQWQRGKLDGAQRALSMRPEFRGAVMIRGHAHLDWRCVPEQTDAHRFAVVARRWALCTRDASPPAREGQRTYARPRGRTRWITIVRAAVSSSTITRQSPTRSRDSGRPLSLRRSAFRGSLARRSMANSTRCLTCGSRRSRWSLSARRSNSTDPRLRRHAQPCLRMISA